MSESSTESQAQFFAENGYCILPDFLSQEDVEAMKNRAGEIIKEKWNEDDAIAIFTTKDHVRDRYFLDSGPKISLFYEPDAKNEDGELVQDPSLCINKIGHNMHSLDEVFSRICHQKKIFELFTEVMKVEDPHITQSMFIMKNPKIGGEVLPHQDATFLYDSEESLVAIWVALEDATIENGCLWAVPGSHVLGLPQRFVRVDENSTVMTTVDGWEGKKKPVDAPEEEYVPLEVKAGTVIALHGQVVHRSFDNKSDKPRNAFTLHVINGDGKETWGKENWLWPANGESFPEWDKSQWEE